MDSVSQKLDEWIDSAIRLIIISKIRMALAWRTIPLHQKILLNNRPGFCPFRLAVVQYLTKRPLQLL